MVRNGDLLTTLCHDCAPTLRRIVTGSVITSVAAVGMLAALL